ncbi:Na+/H+ antiporter subunit E [Brucella suis]|uniref:Na+/H+ antiporter subunit E n=1 Tax=Brucella suis (strain ATCC 23445 / NCTC 10510) TaxID=470137 RepID=A9WYI1_BRUSI|nr:Na+/H+ antiporter subunit E [Brucella suis]ABY39497.1 Hypothetical protein, conserved [Brucella suis ATCC 23445]AIB19159.1 Na(+) H(+) antiporter subunit E [Brucella suis bv. 2]AIB22536.1 Na(+) H(+) antiporter subunit E [Brucella suis bv. 2]AIB25895.1 Na(+) H(+) antiporter subunit E [Brucella suis bv. 2]AIB29286.1 Na(+) H(+) antiporter subunit E [Brucella suis bv. 2]
MKKILPYPLLFVSLVLFWLLLNSFTRAQFILGLVIAFGACRVMMALESQKNHIRSPRMMIWLLYAASIDVLRSNIAVVRLILSPGRQRHPGFVVIPLELQNRTALAVLACMITASPGTAWVDYNAARGILTIHVLDLEDAETWRHLIKERYERPLIEIFGAVDIVEGEKTA